MKYKVTLKGKTYEVLPLPWPPLPLLPPRLLLPLPLLPASR